MRIAVFCSTTEFCLDVILCTPAITLILQYYINYHYIILIIILIFILVFQNVSENIDNYRTVCMIWCAWRSIVTSHRIHAATAIVALCGGNTKHNDNIVGFYWIMYRKFSQIGNGWNVVEYESEWSWCIESMEWMKWTSLEDLSLCWYERAIE